MDSVRQAIIEHIQLLADPVAQLEYEKSVPIANVPAELACQFYDLYLPDTERFELIFNQREKQILFKLERLIDATPEIESGCVSDVHQCPEWLAVISYSKDIAPQFDGRD